MFERSNRSAYLLCGLVQIICFSAIGFAQNGDIVGVHDPCMIKDSDAYYLFSTGRGIPMRKSHDMETWTRIGSGIPRLPAWATELVPNAKFPWAPDISFFDGEFHLYYSVSTFGSNRSAIGLATNTTLDPNSPSYAWKDQGVVVQSDRNGDFNAIDPNVVLDERGQPWLSFGSFWSGIKIVRLDGETGKPEGDLIHIAGRNGGAIEAPFIIRHGRWFYLFASFDNCCKGANSTYKIMVGRSDKVEGPYVDSEGTKMTDGGGTLVLGSHEDVRGPGHNAVFSEGGKDYLIYHFYDASNGGKPTLQIRPLRWTEADWPTVE